MPSENRTDAQHDENLRMAYQQLCSSIQTIDDFRSKLLGFLPLVSGAGAFVLLNVPLTNPPQGNSAQQFLGPIGIFGFVVTLGLFGYELHGIKKCDHLLEVGRQMERGLNIHGRFRQRPFNVAGFIDEPFTARIIYPSVLAAWAFVASLLIWPTAAPWIAVGVFVVFCVGSFLLNLKVTLQDELNISEIIDQLLQGIPADMPTGLSAQEGQELRVRIKQLAQQNRYPSQRDWEALRHFTTGLTKAPVSQPTGYTRPELQPKAPPT